MAKDDKKGGFSFAKEDMDRELPKSVDYDERIAELQTMLVRIEQAYLGSDHSAVIVFEGWDAAGKGGTIRRISNVLDPRGFKVWPIAAPTPEELKRHYLSRFWQRLPGKGEIAVFDRSWYGRVLVERVEAITPETDWRRAYREINEFERLLTDNGTRVVKIFLAIDRKEQLERFVKRMDDPLKRWKLSAEDFRNRGKWDAYIEAGEEMIAKTSTEAAPWHVVASNHKKYSRVTAIQHIVDDLSAGLDLTPKPLPPNVREAAEQAIAAEKG
ncbi:UDP-galactose-lipid carrier transferase [Aureimonas endophytica]|uniref:UDP-galactose-lipid carrier transferase n=1 Tax=Aureimonas endophytica TaxID=2027858 RepID=A0A916ZPG4_9HYPH|nr:polyphosphate kinase [Aureimonas endophytica]GGE07812.1 UDP-galactose-lipid carrier transferase [Aureimonas endophytica]